MTKKKIQKVILLALCSGLFAGCSQLITTGDATGNEGATIDALNEQMHDQTLAVGNRVPQGVVRYCWEEPMVEFEPNGPGVDASGKWYNPYYLAVREVRQGKWRPCRPGSENRASEHQPHRSN